jgi:hypothetical protein
LPTWDKDIRPILFAGNQSGMDWVLANISKLLGQAFVVAKAVIEEISLPSDTCDLGCNSFLIAN